MESLYKIILLLLDFAKFFIIAHFIMSWLISFQVLNLHQQFVQQVWYGLSRILDPLYRPIRSILPPMGGLDLAPLVALFGIYALRIIMVTNEQFFYSF